MKKYFPCFFLIALFACNDPVETKKEEQEIIPETIQPLKTITYTLVEAYPHDTTSFTEGLLVHDGKLFESTGATDNLPQTRSLFGIVNLKTGKIDVKAELDRKKYFGEGIAVLNDKIYQLTYQSQVGFIYDVKTFKNMGQFSYKNKEGWGLTSDGTNLIMSDGTSDLTFLEPKNLNFLKSINVNTINYDMADQLNELEHINGFIYANIWRTNIIIKIDPATGKIVGSLDLSALAAKAKSKYKNSLEMNGIAFDPVTKNIYITGKMWPEIYRIEIQN